MNEEEIDLRELINVLLKKKWLIIGIFLIAVITAAIISYFVLDPAYEAHVSIQFKPPKETSSLITYHSIEGYTNLVKDIEIEEEIIKIMDLDKSPHNLSAHDLQKKIATNYVVETNIIELSFQFKDPEVAKNVVNQLANLFVEKQNKIYSEEINEIYHSIKDQFEISKKDFYDIEGEKIKFNVANNVNTLESDINRKRNRLNDYNNRLIDINFSLNKQLATRELISSELEKQDKTIKLIKSFDDNQYFQRIISEIIEGNIESFDFNYEIEEKNPIYYNLFQDFLNSKSTIKMLEVEKEKIIPDIDNLAKEIDSLNEELVDRKLKESYLNREHDLAKEDYNNLNNKYNEIEQVYNTKSEILEINRTAYQPKSPIKPNKKLNIAIAGVLGLFMGIFIAFFAEFWQSGKQ
jgi:polysaccharide biosynthesis transport protein